MAEYWECGDPPWPDIEEFVDQNVGEALKHYVQNEGYLTISWSEAPEPSILFLAGESEFEFKASLFELLVFEIGTYRPGGANRDDLFYDPEGDRRIILMQELMRTYLKWKEGGVYIHQPAKDENG